MKIAYIYQYSRVSSANQVSGLGLIRQRSDEVAKRLSIEFNLPIYGQALSDSGKSAFKGKHIEKGVFGEFLDAIARGEVQKNSILIVEALDRISRQSVNVSAGLMLQIINAGVRIYTVIDDMFYSSEDPELMGKLIVSIVKLSAANDESDKKSKRTKSNIRIACERYITGERDLIVAGGKPVAWMTAQRQPIPENIEDVKKMIELRKKGNGYMRIANFFESKYGYKKWAANNVRKILMSRALYGERTITSGETKYVLEEYYPVLMSKADWLSIQPEQKKINSTSSKSCLLTGINVSRCGHCGKSIIGRYLESKNIFRLVCDAKYKKSSNCVMSFNAYMAEFLVLQMCADKVWTNNTIDTSDIDNSIAELEIQLKDLESQLSSMTKIPAMFISKVAELEEKLELQKEEREKAKLASIELSMVNEWEALATNTSDLVALSDEQRIEYRGMIQNAIKVIKFYKHDKMYSIEVEFKDGEMRKGLFKGRLGSEKYYVDIKTVNDKVKLQANGVELCDHLEEMIHGFPKHEVPASVLDLL